MQCYKEPRKPVGLATACSRYSPMRRQFGRFETTLRCFRGRCFVIRFMLFITWNTHAQKIGTAAFFIAVHAREQGHQDSVRDDHGVSGDDLANQFSARWQHFQQVIPFQTERGRLLGYSDSPVTISVNLPLIMFLVLTPCTLVGRWQRFGDKYRLCLQGRLSTDQSTLCQTSERHRQPYRRQKLGSTFVGLPDWCLWTQCHLFVDFWSKVQ
jgi:hypothetical protein